MPVSFAPVARLPVTPARSAVRWEDPVLDVVVRAARVDEPAVDAEEEDALAAEPVHGEPAHRRAL
jgi:hypothetical protein